MSGHTAKMISNFIRPFFFSFTDRFVTWCKFYVYNVKTWQVVPNSNSLASNVVVMNADIWGENLLGARDASSIQSQRAETFPQNVWLCKTKTFIHSHHQLYLYTFVHLYKGLNMFLISLFTVLPNMLPCCFLVLPPPPPLSFSRHQPQVCKQLFIFFEWFWLE